MRRSPAMSPYTIRSGTDAIDADLPEIPYVIEQKLRRYAKISVIGKWKTAKSFFTIQMGMAIASGSEFLGFRTTESNVLYVNFEISEEMFQQRIQDMHHVLGYDLSRFKYLTITDLSLDLHTQELDEILTQSFAEGFPVEVLILDPRWKSIKRDSNQDEVINAFCTNLDKLMRRFNLTVWGQRPGIEPIHRPVSEPPRVVV
jgi:RecA-family ATPase